MAKHLDDTQGHPILRFLDVLERGLDEIAETPAWSLTTTETTQVVTRLEADLARLAEVEARASPRPRRSTSTAPPARSPSRSGSR